MGNRFFNINSFTNLLNGITPVSVDIASHKTSKSTRVSEDGTTIFITPDTGNKIVVKSVYISSNSNSGEARIEFTNGEEILPLFIDNRTKTAAGDFNQIGAIDDTVQLVVENLGTGKIVFFGVSYIEINK